MNSREFFNLFNLTERDYLKNYIWDNTVRPDIGFALVRTYPPNKRFIPAKKQDGSDDTVMLLKVFLTVRDKENPNKVSVGVTVSKISLFTLDKRDHFHAIKKAPSVDSALNHSNYRNSAPISRQLLTRFFTRVSLSFMPKGSKRYEGITSCTSRISDRESSRNATFSPGNDVMKSRLGMPLTVLSCDRSHTIWMPWMQLGIWSSIRRSTTERPHFWRAVTVHREYFCASRGTTSHMPSMGFTSKWCSCDVRKWVPRSS